MRRSFPKKAGTVWRLWQAALPSEEQIVLRSLLQRLGADEYRLVVLHSVSGMRFREIAEALGLPLSTVLSKYHRAMKKLKKAWEEESEHE